MPKKDPKGNDQNVDNPTNIKDTNLEITGTFPKGNYAKVESVNELKEEVSKLKDDLTEAKREFEKSRFDLITILGLFVGLITFLGLEVQIFKIINNQLIIIGVTIFFIASILLFILCMNTVVNKLHTITWKDFNNPIYIILIILLLVSIIFILLGGKDNSQYQRSKFFYPSIYEK